MKVVVGRGGVCGIDWRPGMMDFWREDWEDCYVLLILDAACWSVGGGGSGVKILGIALDVRIETFSCIRGSADTIVPRRLLAFFDGWDSCHQI